MSILKREPFLVKLNDGALDDFIALFDNMPADISALCEKRGVDNFSIWYVSGFAFGYYEITKEYTLTDEDEAALKAFGDAVSACGEILGNGFTQPMRLMYSDIGIVREDKSLIRHRVFATCLKPGCEEEYKRRHDELAASHGDTLREGPDSNFTIWHTQRYIFGYCELVRAFDHEKTEEELAATIAWETRGLEIMDWITDDVDWLTGEKHDSVKLVWAQK